MPSPLFSKYRTNDVTVRKQLSDIVIQWKSHWIPITLKEVSLLLSKVVFSLSCMIKYEVSAVSFLDYLVFDSRINR